MLSGGRTLFLVSHNETRPAAVLHPGAVPAGRLAGHRRPARRRARGLPQRHGRSTEEAVTAPVVVDPAPPDLATGLEALAAGRALGQRPAVLLVAADLTVHAAGARRPDRGPAAAPRRPSSATAAAGRTGPAGRAPGGCWPPARRRTGCPSRARRSPALSGSVRGTARPPRPPPTSSRRWPVGTAGRATRWRTCSSAWCAAASGSAPSAWTPGRGGAARPSTARPARRTWTRWTAGRCTTSGSPGPPRPTTASSPPSSAGRSPACSRRGRCALGLTPNQVTAVSVVVGLAAAALFAVGEPVGARRRCAAAAAVPGARLRRRRRRPLHPPVQPAGCLAGRVDRPAQGVRLLRRPRVGRRRRADRVAAGGRDDRAADGPAQRRLHVHRGQGPARGRRRYAPRWTTRTTLRAGRSATSGRPARSSSAGAAAPAGRP